MKKQQRVTKREEFLQAMDRLLPWRVWVEIICPYYPAMTHTVKGGQNFFGGKVHIGVDACSGYIHSISMTPANRSSPDP